MLLDLLTYSICGIYVLMMILFFIGWKQTPVNYFPSAMPVTKASIIIPVRDERDNIQKIVANLASQNYPKSLYEIIVVDDFSTDNTLDFAKQMNIGNCKCIKASNGCGKKNAITEGIHQASGDLIITTDADCKMGEEWLGTIVNSYEKYNPKMICGPVLLKKYGTFQEIMQAQEMLILTGCGIGASYFNKPILCSGANLAYEKKMFFEVGGFGDNSNILTGDDIFLMQKFKMKYKNTILYLKQNEASVYTNPEQTAGNAFTQRKRWLSKTFSYGFSYITGVAIVVFLMNFLLLMNGILCMLNSKYIFVFVSCFLAKMLVDFMMLSSTSFFFNVRSYRAWFFISALIYPIYAFAVGVLSTLIKYSWKGRES